MALVNMTKNILLFVLLFIYTGLAAQEKKRIADSLLREVDLEEVTIGATRFPESKKHIAQNVLTISRKKIAFYAQPTTAELLSQTGQVIVQKSQSGGGSPVIRGFEANKVLIVVDGIRMNNAIFRGGHLQNVLSIDNAVLDKAEVLFGPSSVIYGSDALGGVMSFYTVKPIRSTSAALVTKTNASVHYASAYGLVNGHVDVNMGGKRLGSLTSLTFSDFGDLRQGSRYYSEFPEWGKRNFYVKRVNGTDSMITNDDPEKQRSTGYEQYDLLQKFLFNTGKVMNTINLQYSTTSDINRYDRLTEVNNLGVARSAEWYYGPQQRVLLAWHLGLPATKFFDRAEITPAYQEIEESRHNRNFRSTQLNHRFERVKVVSMNADFFKSCKQSEFTYGTEFVYNKVSSSAYAENINTGERSALDTRYPDGKNNTQSYALYVTFLHKFSTQVTLNSGARFTYNRLFSAFHDTTFFPFPFKEVEQTSSSLTGNIGLVIRPANRWKISGLIASGFRTPNIDDMSKVFESSAGNLVIPNPDLKPEITINYELGVSKMFARKIQLGITGWYTRYYDALTAGPGTFNGSSTVMYNGSSSQVITTVNKDRAYVWGVSGNVAADLNTHFSFNSVMTYTYGRIKEDPKDYPLDHISPLFGKSSLTAKFSKFSFEIFIIYNSTKDSINYNLRGEDNQFYSADPLHGFTPAWTTLNLRSAYQMNDHLSCQFAVENMTDKFYRVFASGLSAPGRNFTITLRGRF
jgi:hemoglobin/transferrin/lactoferrin receptor protein